MIRNVFVIKTKYYIKRRYTLIDFDLENKTLQVVENKNKISEESCFSIYKGTHKITVKEMKAIFLKYKELGWVEE